MHSRTKKQLKKDELDHLVRYAFSDRVVIKRYMELTEGWYNVAYSLELNNGQEMILKVAPPPDVPILTYESDLMRTEVAVFNLLKKHTKVPVPDILFSDFNQELINRDYYFMEKLQGKPWNHTKDSLSKEQNNQIWFELGMLCGQINSIETTHFGYFGSAPEVSSSSWVTTFSKMIETLLQDGGRLGAKLPISNDKIHDLVDSYKSALAFVQTPKLVHWDLWEGNIFIEPNAHGFHIEGIIDCERAHYADPVMEVAFNVAMTENQDDHPFLKGIAKESGIDMYRKIKNFKQRRQLYNIYLFLIILIESKSRQYQGPEAIKVLKWAKDSLLETYKHLNE